MGHGISGPRTSRRPSQGLLSSLADTYHSNTVRLPSVSVSVRNASRCLSDFRTGGCPMAGRGAGGFGSRETFLRAVASQPRDGNKTERRPIRSEEERRKRGVPSPAATSEKGISCLMTGVYQKGETRFPPFLPRNVRVSEHLFGLPGLTNVGRVANGIFRGAQPKPEGYATLKAMGVKTVINLRTRHGEREAIEAAGMRYVEIPMNVRKALSVMTDKANQPVFVHCSRGADRTGVVAAVYRMEVDGWSEAEAEAEMEAFGFHEVWVQL